MSARGCLLSRFVIALVVGFSISPAAVLASDPSPGELVDSLSRYIDAFRRSSFVIRERMYSKLGDFTTEYFYREATRRIWLDGTRRKEVTSITAWPMATNGKKEESKSASEWVADGKRVITVVRDPNTGKAFGVGAILRELTDQERRQERDLWYYAPLIEGTFGGDPLPEFLRRSHLIVKKGQLDGQEVWVLEATSEWGDYTVSFDPKRGYTPLHIAQRKEGRHKGSDGVPLEAISAKSGGPYHLSTKDWKANRLEMVQGRPLVTEYTVTNAAVTGEKKVSFSDRFVVSLSEVNFSPDFSTNDPFKVTTPIPDGFPVTVSDQKMIKHEWRGGEIVKSIHQDSVASLEGNWFQRGRGLGLGLLALAGLAVGGAVLFWRSRRWNPAS